MGGFAWVTLATNDSYSLGALVLAHSLKQAGTAHQLAVLVTPGVTNAMREKLATVFNIIQEVNVLDSRDEANLKLLKRPELGITFTKLHCWRLTQFDKCVFLDADTLVLQNCDELFERDELSAAPDVGWPDCFNSGVFVYRPSTDTYDSLIQLALEKGSFDGGDQGLLNLYFSDWAHKDISKHLPFIYNMCSTACYSYLPAFRQFGANAKIVHFIGASKPWLQYFNTETRKVQPSGDSSHLQEVLQRWWDIFCSLIHPHLSPAMPQGQSQNIVSPSYFPPQYAPPSEPIYSSADDYENAWDPWDEYDRKIAQSTHTSVYTPHNDHNSQPIESLNTNASFVADQPTVYSQPQSYDNYSTNSDQHSCYYQSPVAPVYHPLPENTQPHQQSSDHHYYPPSNPVQEIHHQHVPSCNPSQEIHHQHIPPCNPPQDIHYQHVPPCDPPQEVHHQFITSNPPQEVHHHYVSHETNGVENISCRTSEPSGDNKTDHDRFQNLYITESRPPLLEPPKNSDPVLTKECEATTTVSNDRSLHSTKEDSSKDNDDAGLAGAFAQLTLGVPRTTQQDALENLLRKQAWEVGNIDYLGRDSFDNIWSKITETLSAGLPSETTLEIAPVQSQPTASPQEVAKSVENSVTLQSVGTTKSEPIQVQPSAVETLVAPSESATQPSADTSKTEPVEVDDHSPVETSVPPSQSAAITTKSEPVEAQSPPLQSSGAPLQKKEALLASDTLKSLPVEAQSAPVDTSVTKEPEVATDLTKSQPLEIQSTQTSGSLPAATLQTELVKSSPASPVAAKSAVDESKLKDAPRGAQPVDVAKSSPVQSVESPIPTELVASVEPPKTLKQSPAATPQAETTPSKYAPVVQPTESPKTAPSPPKPISQSSTAPVASSQPSKDSPKTKITEATPPATPSSPQLEKTKQALAAEASIPETPPPTEGSSVPTPPPRKTDKPKKTVTKPKK